MAFTFRLQTRDGQILGDHSFAVPNWKPGDTIPLGAGETYRVVEVVHPVDADDEGLPILIVERVG